MSPSLQRDCGSLDEILCIFVIQIYVRIHFHQYKKLAKIIFII